MGKYIGSTATIQPTQASAGGVYTLKDQLVYNAREQWPVDRDPYFNYTTLLLQGDVPYTRGRNPMTTPLAYNSDASSNNFLITPNGDVGPRPFSPYFGGNYSVYFDGTGDYLSTTTPAIGTNNFTVEGWVYLTSNTSYASVYSSIESASGTGIFLGFQNTGILNGVIGNGATSGAANGDLRGTVAVTTNVWHHVAFVRNGTTISLYLDGALYAIGTTSSIANVTATSAVLGRFYVSTDNFYLSGYASNVRMLNGTAQYTPAGYVVPTQAFATDTTNQVLLACASNRFIDTNTATTAKTITRNGDSRITDNSPFVSTDFTTGSAYFDGSGDSLSGIGTTSSFNFMHSPTALFTFQCWVYPTVLPTSGTPTRHLFANQQSSAEIGVSVSLEYSGGNVYVNLFIARGVASVWVISANSTGTIAANTWTHIAITYDQSLGSANAKFYINGVAAGTATKLANAPSSSNATYAAKIGAYQSLASYDFSGYISDLRITNTIETITLPTAPVTPVSGTTLLTLQTRAPSQNSTFLDSSPNEFLITRSGNATQGTFTPFSPSGWSAYVAGDVCLDVASDSGFNLSDNANFTIEFWINAPASGTGNELWIASGWSTTANLSWSLSWRSNNAIEFYGRTAGNVGSIYFVNNSGNNSILPNTWAHYAAVRNGNTIYIYVNGALINSAAVNGTPASSTNCRFFADSNNSVKFIGNISNFRFSRSAVYTSAFTPSTQDLTTTSQNAANVVLLAFNRNRIVDLAKNLSFTYTTGSTRIQPLSPFAPTSAIGPQLTGGSAYFDGNADFLDLTITPINNSNYTIEFWAYPTQNSSDQLIVQLSNPSAGSSRGSSSAFGLWYIAASGKYYWYSAGGSFSGTSFEIINSITSPINSWTHVAVTRNTGGVFTMYINGVSSGTTTNNVTYLDAVNAFTVGKYYKNSTDASENFFNGYISNIRFVVGQVLYTSNFTPPTAPLTSVTGTRVLLNFNNSAAVDATGRNVLESIGKAQNSVVQAKWDLLRGGSALQFDGSTSTVRGNTPANWTYLHDGSSWTIEFWLYPVDVVNFQGLICTNGAGSANIGLNIQMSSSTISLSFTRGASGSSASFTSTGTLTANSWNFVGITFNGSTKTCSFFINGASAGSSSNTGFAYSSSAPTYPLNIGQTGEPTYPYFFNGYIDDLRITRGIARTITANPTGPFPRG
jgi:hypothetical protein